MKEVIKNIFLFVVVLCVTNAKGGVLYDECADFNSPQYQCVQTRNIVNGDWVYQFVIRCVGLLNKSEPIPTDSYNQYTSHSCSRNVRIEASNLPSITSATFSPFSQIEELDLQKDNIQNIVPGAFNTLHNLQALNLSDNHITTIKRGIFNTFGNLRDLRLESNRISQIEGQAFLGCQNLQQIRLQNNNLSILPEDFPGELNQLTYLDLSMNHLETFQFNGTSLDYLNLSGNQLELFQFYSEVNLTILDLSNNKIPRLIDWRLSNVQHLYLNNNILEEMIEIHPENMLISLRGNKIEVLNKSESSNSRNLLTLDLGYNSICSLKSVFFETLALLQKLYLDHNKISQFDLDVFNTLTQLTHLDLSSNKIKMLQQGTFSNLHNLLYLNVSSNQFVELHHDLSLGYLKGLYVDDNRISAIDVEALLQQSGHLQEISFKDNHWSCKDLMRIYINLNQSHITVLKGDSYNVENVQGIACEDTQITPPKNGVPNLNTKAVDELMNDISGKFKLTLNSAFENSEFYKYFQTDYRRSNFFKYFDTHVAKNSVFNGSEVESHNSALQSEHPNGNVYQNILVLILLVLIIMTCGNFVIIYFIRVGTVRNKSGNRNFAEADAMLQLELDEQV